MTARFELLGSGSVEIEALALPIGPTFAARFRTLIPLKAEPAQRVENSLEGVLRTAPKIGVIDSENQRTLRTASK